MSDGDAHESYYGNMNCCLGLAFVRSDDEDANGLALQHLELDSKHTQ
jgi:hypothetical protein